MLSKSPEIKDNLLTPLKSNQDSDSPLICRLNSCCSTVDSIFCEEDNLPSHLINIPKKRPSQFIFNEEENDSFENENLSKQKKFKK